MVRVLLMVMLCALLVTGGQAAEVGDTPRVAPPPGGPIPLPYPTTIERGEPTIALAPATTGVFLYVEGIAGASTSESFTNWIDVTDWEYLAELAIARSGGGGASAGRSTSGPLVVIKPVDAASPQLFLACASGKHIPKANLVVASAGRVVLQIAMEGVFVVRAGRQLADGDAANVERVHLSAQRVRWGVPQYGPTGAVTAIVRGGWDFGTGQPW